MMLLLAPELLAIELCAGSLESELGPAAVGGLEKELGPSSVAAGGGDSPKFSPRTKEKGSKVNLKRQQAKLRALARMKKNAG